MDRYVRAVHPTGIMLTCRTCGAVVLLEFRADHDAWHDALTADLLRAMSEEASRRG